MRCGHPDQHFFYMLYSLLFNRFLCFPINLQQLSDPPSFEYPISILDTFFQPLYLLFDVITWKYCLSLLWWNACLLVHNSASQPDLSWFHQAREVIPDSKVLIWVKHSVNHWFTVTPRFEWLAEWDDAGVHFLGRITLRRTVRIVYLRVMLLEERQRMVTASLPLQWRGGRLGEGMLTGGGLGGLN